ncbi:cupin [Jannaschia pagri]|uniref:Cupin n=1 Tax=Jannaschia pagri TaxID=2829797 RepID=A0ABQ4NL61_9RHOB|nr:MULTISPECIES: cupin domain-containing protein [unclassified Jannaschia]GIT91308.1 cupin [Jannaschia sp. AI_61]GIT95141.1 cupin [Jannaschia sp. AI_62]
MTPQATGPALLIREADLIDSEWNDPKRGTVSFKMLVDAEHGPSDALVHGIATLAPGGVEKSHSHDIAETAYVLSGRGSVLLPGGAKPIEAGDTVFIPAGLTHGWAAEDSEMRFLFSFPVARLADVAYHWPEP